jgi:hypothetical protein
VIHPEHPVAQAGGVVDVVRDQQQRRPVARADLADSIEALFCKIRIADAEHLVDDQEAGGNDRRCGEHETHRHAARVGFDRLVDVLLELSELDHIGDTRARLRTGQPDVAEVRQDVLATGQVRMEAGAELQEGLRFSLHLQRSGRRRGRSGDETQQRALARAVPADDAHFLAARDVERDVREREMFANRRARSAQESQRVQHAMPGAVIQPVPLRQAAGADDDVIRDRRQRS